jgi:hypothetical protein
LSYLINPYHYDSAVIDDTDLKSYHKFNETSGDIINVSESSADLGTSADIQMTGGTYNQSAGSPFGYSMLFDGVDDFGVFGTSKTNYKFTHDNSGITSTICYWAKVLSFPASNEDYFLSILNTDDGKGFMQRVNNNQTTTHFINSGGSGDILVNAKTTSNYIPDTSNWYFYVYTYNQSETSNNLTYFRNAGNEENGTKTSLTPSSDDSTYVLTVGARGSDHTKFIHAYMAEMSIWDRVLSDDEITTLYNGGSGQAIY